MSVRPVNPADADPGLALQRIAFLLERALEPSYRVRAFRTAAAVLDSLDPAQVRQGVEDGSLRKLRGIGDVTFQVISEALSGEIPEYLAKLEAEYGPLVAAGDELRAALRGDLHTHSDWSDGGSPIAEMAITARDLGHEYTALTDHSPRLTVANGLSVERLRQQIEIVHALNAELAPFRLLTGIEVDILEDGSLDQEDELLAELDVVVASVHSKLRMAAPEMTARMLTAVRNPLVDVLGHCTGRLITGGRGTRPESEFDAAAVFAACAEHQVAVEINSRPERLDPPRRLLRLAVESGCLFSIDTDAHAPGQLDFQSYGCARAVECVVPVEQVVNSWPLERLLEWTHRAV